MGQDRKIILASTSRYRKALLDKLALPFSQIDPDYIERGMAGETPVDKSKRLALGKAQGAAAKLNSPAPLVIIGSDQVAECRGTVLSKPGSFSKAIQQLEFCMGQWTSFHTSVALVDETGKPLAEFTDEYRLQYRDLPRSALEAYLKLDEPYDCAGSIKAESYGILMIAETTGLDINTLYGLPLIKLTDALMELGLLNHFK